MLKIDTAKDYFITRKVMTELEKLKAPCMKDLRTALENGAKVIPASVETDDMTYSYNIIDVDGSAADNGRRFIGYELRNYINFDEDAALKANPELVAYVTVPKSITALRKEYSDTQLFEPGTKLESTEVNLVPSRKKASRLEVEDAIQETLEPVLKTSGLERVFEHKRLADAMKAAEKEADKAKIRKDKKAETFFSKTDDKVIAETSSTLYAHIQVNLFPNPANELLEQKVDKNKTVRNFEKAGVDLPGYQKRVSIAILGAGSADDLKKKLEKIVYGFSADRNRQNAFVEAVLAPPTPKKTKSKTI